MAFERTSLDTELEPTLRTYRRLWLSQRDLEEAKSTIDELLALRLPIPRRKAPSPLLMALTTALVVSYARPFINSRGQSALAEKAVPGSLLRVFSSEEREFHEIIVAIRHREVAHSDADAMELSLKLYKDGDAGICRLEREPFRRKELRVLHRMIRKLEMEIDHRCEEFRAILPWDVWI